jgi:ribonucleoside-diphosphate reductase alpha chain
LYDDALKASIEYFDGDDLAGKVFLDKYALRDNENNILEKTPTDMHHRLAKEFARIEKNKFKNPLSEEEIFSYFDHFKYIIPQGSPMYGIGNNYQYVSLSNCYLVENPKDSYASILQADEQIVQISKRRGGCGIDLSELRPIGTPTKNAAKTSTGIIPFMERYSNSIREVGQNNRRGALMITLSIHHPEIISFINIKKDLKKITGANISVRLTDEFLKAVEKDIEYELRWPVDSKKPKISKMTKAKEVWNEIINGAWQSAEPGILMWDNIIKNTPSDCYEEYASKGVNPCLIGNTKILTDKGEIEIKDVVENIDKYQVFSYNQNNKQIELDKIVSGGKTKENANIIKLEMDDGSILELTPDHKVFTENKGWIMDSELTQEDFLVGIE